MNTAMRIVVGVLLIAAPTVSQFRTQVEYGGFPAPHATGLVQVEIYHFGSSGGVRNKDVSIPVPMFDPSLGVLRGVSLRFTGEVDYGTIDLNTTFSFSGRTFDAVALTDMTFIGPGLSETGQVMHHVHDVVPGAFTSYTFEVPPRVMPTLVATIPTGDLSQWVGPGALSLTMSLHSDVSINFPSSNDSTWPLLVNGQIEVTYSYGEEGHSTRGLPGKGPSVLEFNPNGITSYVLSDNALFDPRFRDGTQLPLGDDDFVDQPLAFPFEMPDGRMVNSIRIDSNGRVSDPVAGLQSEWVADEAAFVNATSPILAPCWHDFSARDQGSIWFHGDAHSAVVTWYEVPDAGRNNENTFQLQLFPDGSFRFLYVRMAVERANALIGVSQGSGLGQAGSVDLSTLAVSGPAMVDRTTYEFFPLLTDFETPASMPVLAGIDAPALGLPYEVELQNEGTAVAATLLAGAPDSLNVGFLFPNTGTLGCYLRVGLLGLVESPMALGQRFVVPVPPDPALAGVIVEFQAVTLDPANAGNALLLNFSNGMTAKIGG